MMRRNSDHPKAPAEKVVKDIHIDMLGTEQFGVVAQLVEPGAISMVQSSAGRSGSQPHRGNLMLYPAELRGLILPLS